MWTQTAFTQSFGLELPLVLGPFGGGFSSVPLAAIVSNAGGLGSFGAHHLRPGEISSLVGELRRHTARPFAVNLWVSNRDEAALRDYTAADYQRHAARLAPFFEELGVSLPPFPADPGPRFEEQAEALVQARPPVFSFVYGVPAPAILDACRSVGIRTLGTATTAEEAVALEEAGVEAVVATGLEAGGHRASFLRAAPESLTGGLALIPLVRARVRCPVVAAGGIAGGRAVLAALTLGADAVQVGTAFLACEESGTNELHRRALWSEAAGRTVLTRVYSGRLARGVPNRLWEALAECEQDPAPYPIQGLLTGALRQAAVVRKRADLISLWAGQAAPLLRHRRAPELLRALVQEVDEAAEWVASRRRTGAGTA